MKIIIYRIWNKTQNKSYIGATNNLKRRMIDHKHINPHFLEGCYEVQELKICETRDEADKYERLFVKTFQTQNEKIGWNKQNGGTRGFVATEKQKQALKVSLAKMLLNNPNIGKKRTEETKQKISIAKKGKPNLALRGRKKTKEHIEKHKKSLKEFYKNNSHPFLGKKHTEEAKEKMSEGQRLRAARGDVPFRGRKHTEAAKEKMRKTKKEKKNKIASCL